MSGGSFNYLEHRLGSTKEYIDLLAELKARTGATDWDVAVWDLEKLIYALKQVDRLRAMLEPIVHAVEWTVSGDWGNDQLEEAVAKYEREHG